MSNPRHPLTHDLTLEPLRTDPADVAETIDAASLVTDWRVLLGFDAYDLWLADLARLAAARAKETAK